MKEREREGVGERERDLKLTTRCLFSEWQCVLEVAQLVGVATTYTGIA